MTYGTPQALRMALEQRLLNQSRETDVSLDRLRRRVIFERVVARLQFAEPGRWVLKGGMALEVRLQDRARLTKDIDFGLRDEITEPADLQERLVEALSKDPFDDWFTLLPTRPTPLMEDSSGAATWRSSVRASLAGRPFGAVRLDISPRTYELHKTQTTLLPNTLSFAGIQTSDVELIDVNRHAAEKFHAMLKTYRDRENTRVRDLVDVVILSEHGLLDIGTLSTHVRQVWQEREGAKPPVALPTLPTNWSERYETLAELQDLTAASFQDAVTVANELWSELSL